MWEHRYGVVKPSRTAAGHRRYGMAAVERLKTVAALVRQGHGISTVASLDDETLRRLAASARAPASTSADDVAARHVLGLREAIVRFDVLAAANQLAWLKTVLGAKMFVLDVAVPLFATIGELVATSELDISQEHAISALIRDQIGDLLQDLRLVPSTLPSVPPIVFASPEDDRHEFGILLGAVLAGVRGLPVWYGGADLPAQSLANAVHAVGARHVVLGNAPVPAAERRVSFADYLLDLDAQLPAATTLHVGGNGDRPRTKLPSGRRVRYLNTLDELDVELARLVNHGTSRPT